MERVDLYQLHMPDHNVPLGDSIGAHAELRAEGKIRQIDVSHVDLHQLRVAQRVVPIPAIPNCYHIGNRK